MKRFPIGFIDTQTEKQYLSQQHIIEYLHFKKVVIPFLVIEAVYLIEGLVFQEYLVVGYAILEFILIILAYTLGSNRSLVFDLMVCFISTLHFAKETNSIFGEHAYNKYEIACVIYSTAYMLQLFQIGCRSSFKMATIAGNSITQLTLYSINSDINIEVFIELVIFTIYIMYHIYLIEIQKRQLFIQTQNVKIIEDDLIQYLDVSCIRCKYSKNNMQIQLEKSNFQAQQHFGIQDQVSLSTFLRMAKVGKMSLETTLFKLFTANDMTRKQHQLTINYKKERQSTKIIKFQDNSSYWIMIDHQNQQLSRLQNSIHQYRTVIEFIEMDLFQNIRNALIEIDKKRPTIYLIRSYLYLAYNWCLNINTQISDKINPCTYFRLDQVIDRIISIFQHQLRVREIEVQCEEMIIIQDQQKVQQLIINIIQLHISTNSKVMQLYVKKEHSNNINIDIINIHLKFESYNRINNTILSRINEIIKIIGPYKQAKLKEEDQYFHLVISIFNNLKQINRK